MAFGDQIYRQTKLTKTKSAMNASTILNNLLSNVTQNMHKVRRDAVSSYVQSRYLEQ